MMYERVHRTVTWWVRGTDAELIPADDLDEAENMVSLFDRAKHQHAPHRIIKRETVTTDEVWEG